jgi:hypothetical protein
MLRAVLLWIGLLALAAPVGAQVRAVADSLVQAPTAGAGTERPAAYGDDGLDVVRAANRSARLAVLMSFPVPGWGQMYADAPFWSVVAFASQSWFLGSALMERRRLERQKVKRDHYRTLVATDPEDSASLAELEFRQRLVDEHRERARDFLWWAGGAYLIVALDAYVSVELAGFDSDSPPTPDLDKDWETSDDGDGASLSVHFRF